VQQLLQQQVPEAAHSTPAARQDSLSSSGSRSPGLESSGFRVWNVVTGTWRGSGVLGSAGCL
jgi:hypothetical protein